MKVHSEQAAEGGEAGKEDEEGTEEGSSPGQTVTTRPRQGSRSSI